MAPNPNDSNDEPLGDNQGESGSTGEGLKIKGVGVNN
jgi:hypothetical protein